MQIILKNQKGSVTLHVKERPGKLIVLNDRQVGEVLAKLFPGVLGIFEKPFCKLVGYTITGHVGEDCFFHWVY